jgi:hypothetical protein
MDRFQPVIYEFLRSGWSPDHLFVYGQRKDRHGFAKTPHGDCTHRDEVCLLQCRSRARRDEQ